MWPPPLMAYSFNLFPHPPHHHLTKQLCLSLAAQASLGLGAGVVYLDSTGAFCARRLRGILLEQVGPRAAGGVV